MRKCIYILLIFVAQFALSQNFHLKIISQDSTELQHTKTLIYNKLHPSLKDLDEHTKILSDSLQKQGFLQNKIFFQNKLNDSTFVYQLSLGNKIDSLKIIAADSLLIRKLKIISQDTIYLDFKASESFLKNVIQKLESYGYATSKIQLANFKQSSRTIYANIIEEVDLKRIISDLHIVGYSKFPKGILKNLKKNYQNKTFNSQTTNQIINQIRKYNFVSINKDPEVLFTNQNTRIFLYLDKKQSNSFDGYIGFTNSQEQKITFNGYIDLYLQNILNTAEYLNIYWKNDGANQETINIEAEIPYIFQTSFALKPQLNIFKQDSTYQTTKTSIDLGYYLNYNTRLYVGYHSSESNKIAQQLDFSEDYISKFITFGSEYFIADNNSLLFPTKTKLNLRIGLGNRITELLTAKQSFVALKGFHNIYLNNKNSINTRIESYYLNSNQYLTNEMYRSGGIHSIRGFKENSLEANIFYSLQTEYRYLLNRTLYAHSISDIGYLIDNVTNQKHQLFGLGFGFGMFTQNGLFQISYANGFQKNTPVKLSNSIVHLSFKTTF